MAIVVTPFRAAVAATLGGAGAVAYLDRPSSHAPLNLARYTARTPAEAVALLERDGVCVVPDAVGAAALRGVLRSEALADARRASGLRESFVESTAGRWHRREFGAADGARLAACEGAWRPVVDAYLGAGLPRSDLQLLVSRAGSDNQFFHQDNRRRSLTVTLPLVDFTAALGPTQLLPGSQRLTAPTDAEAGVLDCDVLCGGALQPAATAVLPAGAALIYDSRVLHRGLANTTPNVERPMLVYRYDREDAPAPGHGVLSTVGFRLLGKALSVLQ